MVLYEQVHHTTGEIRMTARLTQWWFTLKIALRREFRLLALDILIWNWDKRPMGGWGKWLERGFDTFIFAVLGLIWDRHEVEGEPAWVKVGGALGIILVAAAAASALYMAYAIKGFHGVLLAVSGVAILYFLLRPRRNAPKR